MNEIIPCTNRFCLLPKVIQMFLAVLFMVTPLFGMQITETERVVLEIVPTRNPRRSTEDRV
jgi:hypothetical protein